MATAKMSLGSIFGVVTSSASAVVSIADAVGTTAQTLASEALHMQAKLQEDNRLDLASHKIMVKQNAAKALSEERLIISKWCAKSQENLDLFNQSMSDLEEALESNK
jgi:uncharacterized tellurite resistance protein B-like protein